MNKHQKDTCYSDITLVCAQNPFELGAIIVDMNEKAYVIRKE